MVILKVISGDFDGDFDVDFDVDFEGGDLEGAAAAEVWEDWALAHCEQSLSLSRALIQHVLLVW